MKSLKLNIALFVILSLVFFSCDDPTIEPQPLEIEQIYGEWKWNGPTLSGSFVIGQVSTGSFTIDGKTYEISPDASLFTVDRIELHSSKDPNQDAYWILQSLTYRENITIIDAIATYKVPGQEKVVYKRGGTYGTLPILKQK